jgi:hypothetical protein
MRNSVKPNYWPFTLFGFRLYSRAKCLDGYTHFINKCKVSICREISSS